MDDHCEIIEKQLENFEAVTFDEGIRLEANRFVRAHDEYGPTGHLKPVESIVRPAQEKEKRPGPDSAAPPSVRLEFVEVDLTLGEYLWK